MKFTDYSEWMPGDAGISVHWTSHSASFDGKDYSYREAVSLFDPVVFAEALAEAGAKHCIFTLTHAEQYLALPCAPLEALLPGRTAERDLIGEIISELAKRDIHFIGYYNHSCNNGDDPPWEDACGYSAGISGNLDRFADNICDIVSFIAKRYGKNLAGWWFDSGYSVDRRGPSDTVTTELGSWQFPWDKLADAAKAGYPGCAVTVNAGIGTHFQYTPRQEYCAGEAVSLNQEFDEKAPGMIDHRWLTLDSGWVYEGKAFSEPRFSDDEVKAFVMSNREAERMTTFNIQIDRIGKLNPYSLSQLKRVLR